MLRCLPRRSLYIPGRPACKNSGEKRIQPKFHRADVTILIHDFGHIKSDRWTDVRMGFYMGGCFFSFFFIARLHLPLCVPFRTGRNRITSRRCYVLEIDVCRISNHFLWFAFERPNDTLLLFAVLSGTSRWPNATIIKVFPFDDVSERW